MKLLLETLFYLLMLSKLDKQITMLTLQVDMLIFHFFKLKKNYFLDLLLFLNHLVWIV